MNDTRVQAILALSIAIGLVLGLAILGVPVQFGAHPWWGFQVALFGAPVGAVLAILPVNALLRLLASLIILGIATGAASYGKAQFAASFAEDQFAGRLWYFGWIGICLALAMGVGTMLMIVFRRRSDEQP